MVNLFHGSTIRTHINDRPIEYNRESFYSLANTYEDRLKTQGILGMEDSTWEYIERRMKSINAPEEQRCEIIVLLGVENELNKSLNQLDQFRQVNASQQSLLSKKINSMRRWKWCCWKSQDAQEMIDAMHEMSNLENKQKQFDHERKQVQHLLTFVKGKILFLSNKKIYDLGLN